MIDVAKNLHARRIHALTTSTAHADVIAHLILAAEARVLELAVHHFHADGDAFVFGARLDAIQKRDGVVRAFRVRHAFALAADSNNVGASAGGAFIDRRAERRQEFLVSLFVNEAVFHVTPPGGAMVGMRPYFLSVGQSFGPTRS